MGWKRVSNVSYAAYIYKHMGTQLPVSVRVSIYDQLGSRTPQLFRISSKQSCDNENTYRKSTNDLPIVISKPIPNAGGFVLEPKKNSSPERGLVFFGVLFFVLILAYFIINVKI